MGKSRHCDQNFERGLGVGCAHQCREGHHGGVGRPGSLHLPVWLLMGRSAVRPQVSGYLRFDTMDDADGEQPSAVEAMNKTVNLCKLLTTKSVAPVIRLSMAELSKYGVLFKQCPIKKANWIAFNRAFASKTRLLSGSLLPQQFQNGRGAAAALSAGNGLLRSFEGIRESNR